MTDKLRDVEGRHERRKAEKILEAIVKSSPPAIIVIDPVGMVQMWDSAAERIFGWKEEEVLGRFLPIISADRKTAFVQSTIELTHHLGLTVVAEGVESQEVLNKLTALDCDAAQGYYISRPINASALNSWFIETGPAKNWTLE